MKYLYIVGKKKTGEKFRPSDWSERLSDCLYCFDEDQEINYFNYICTDNYDQTKALKISNELKEIDPIAFNFLIKFANDNNLTIEKNVSYSFLYKLKSLHQLILKYSRKKYS